MTSGEETNKLLKGILIALALKENKREDKVKILKEGGLGQAEVLKILGPAPSTLRTRKSRSKKK